MFKKFSFFIVLVFSLSCSRVDPFIFTKNLNPLHNEIKIFWTKDITEVSFNSKVIKKQGVYYLTPKQYNLSWKYKIIKNHKIAYKWKSSKIDLSNTKELYFEKDIVIKK